MLRAFQRVHAIQADALSSEVDRIASMTVARPMMDRQSNPESDRCNQHTGKLHSAGSGDRGCRMPFFGEPTFRWIGHTIINSAGNCFIRLYGFGCGESQRS